MISSQVRLVRRPVGVPVAQDFAVENMAVGAPGPGEVLVRVTHISLDPYMRGMMNEGASYVRGVEIGGVVHALGLGRVEVSSDERLPVGCWVRGSTGVQTLARLPGEQLERLEPDTTHLPRYLGVLGMPGMTAYFGLLKVGGLRRGDTVLVSGAAGAVGEVAGQIARLKGHRVVGIAGRDEKCRYVVDRLGFDACLNHRTGEIAEELGRLYPDGLDIYFDNVGGRSLDAAILSMRKHGRIVLCGGIAHYNATEPVAGPRNYLAMIGHSVRMEGFLVTDFRDRYSDAVRDLETWIREGKVLAREHVVEGIESFHRAFVMLFSGDNHGKLVLRLGG